MGSQACPASVASWASCPAHLFVPQTLRPQVQTITGLIIGHHAPNKSDAFEFLGIKYGRAPVGDLRFAAPERYVASQDTVYDALNWNADCPFNVPPVTSFPHLTDNGFEIYNKFTAHLGNEQSEDCLALNVWTKATSVHSPSKKPVLVFFHGGRYTIAGPHSPFYSGQYLASQEDIVVVTVNCRLGIFGFPGAPGLEQNAGLRDQRLAVEWVRDNIAGFGGDVERIVIFGQSAGGSAVDNYAVAFADDPIVAGLISMSGTVFSHKPNTPEYASSLFWNVSGTLECGNNTTDIDTAVACVRTKSVPEILAAAVRVPILPSQAIPQSTFRPTVDNQTVWADYIPMFQAGQFAKIPYLAGNNDHESGSYRINAFNFNRTMEIREWNLFDQRAFTCPAKYSTDFRVQHGIPTWQYRYMGDWSNLRLYPASEGRPSSGAYHGSDLTMVFGTALDVTREASTSVQELTSRYMMGAWAAFARNPTDGLEEYGWPQIDSDSTSLVRLGYNNQHHLDLVHASFYDDSCPPVIANDPLPGRGAF